MNHEAAVLKSVAGETMALLAVSAKGKVDGLLFELAVEQRYRNSAAINVEAVYTFPLPIAAVLLDFEVRLAEKLLTATVVEKRAAEAKYEEAIDKGDAAFMLERAGDGLCTVNLGNLLPGEEATVRYRYAQLLRFQQGSVRLTVPTVIAPRYGDPAVARLAPHQAPASDLAVSYPFTLALELHGAIAAGKIASPSHAIATARTEHGVEVTLARAAMLDRDFVLTVGGLPAQSLAVIAKDGNGYVALASFCADVPQTAAEIPLRLKLLVDCSGSMGGDSIEAAKRALHRVLAALTPADRMSYSRFGSTVRHEINRLAAADAETIRAAAACVAKTDADLGGTEMEAALRSVFALGDAEGGADVLLITDGEIWGSEPLIGAARAAQQRVFIVGVGSAPAEDLLRRLAEATGGACEFVAPNEDAEAGILRMFGRLRAPRVDRAEVVWAATPKWTAPLPRGLFGGETIHALAGFDALPAGETELHLVPADGAKPLTANVALPANSSEDATLARVAAAMRIPSCDGETAVALALRYSLLTDRTNFIVVHERAEGEKATDLPALQKVAQMHAAGWGGVGSVHGAMIQAHRSLGFDDITLFSQRGGEVLFSRARDDGAPKFCAIEPKAPTYVETASIDDFLRALDRRIASGPRPALPATLAELSAVGAPNDTLALLRALIAEGHNEVLVVRAFLAALEAQARALGLSRQLLRELRHCFGSPDEQRELRERARAIVANLMRVDA